MNARFDPAVNALLDAHDHPLRKEIDELRCIILGVDRSIEEGVKWNTASFRTEDWFATLNGPKQVKEPMLILHAGAKAKGLVLKDRIPDPEGLITWLGNDRAQIVFRNATDIIVNKNALCAVVSAWIKLIRP
ncbi:MAG: DUF1801 domain-containing protein [Flavobacteriales bacterium]|nr:DUF1801 domain-containing protein [Flavobacteriales bacterium]